MQNHNRDIWIRWNWWKKIVFSDKGHFWLNGYVKKQNDRFWGTENPNISISKSLHPGKVTLWTALSVKVIDLYFFDSTVAGNGYKELLETKFFPSAEKIGWVKTFHFMQDEATSHRTKEVFEAIYNVYGNRVIGLGYPEFALTEELSGHHSPQIWTPLTFSYGVTLKITVIPKIQQQKNW